MDLFQCCEFNFGMLRYALKNTNGGDKNIESIKGNYTVFIHLDWHSPCDLSTLCPEPVPFINGGLEILPESMGITGNRGLMVQRQVVRVEPTGHDV